MYYYWLFFLRRFFFSFWVQKKKKTARLTHVIVRILIVVRWPNNVVLKIRKLPHTKRIFLKFFKIFFFYVLTCIRGRNKYAKPTTMQQQYRFRRVDPRRVLRSCRVVLVCTDVLLGMQTALRRRFPESANSRNGQRV